MGTARIAELYRFPVKGLSGEKLTEASLSAGAHFPGDRIYAIENGPSGFDPLAPAFQPKIRFLMLMRNERLARLQTRLDDDSSKLTIGLPDGGIRSFALGTPKGRASLEEFFADYCKDELRGAPRLLEAPAGFRFTDSSRSGFISLLNLTSVEDLARKVGAHLAPLRFRANIHVAGWDAWRETALVGKILTIGNVRLEVLKMIDRCLATHVDPATGQRDRDVTGTLRRAYGHIECGIYARILSTGRICPGDEIVPEADLFG